jgi:hypothetical protein
LYTYRNETNIAFQRNPPGLQPTSPNVSQVFKFRQKKVSLVASLTNFAPRQFLDRGLQFCLYHITVVLTVNGFTLWSEMYQNHTFHIPKNRKHNLTG